MGVLDFLKGRRAGFELGGTGKVVEIDNTTEDDNWITNKSKQAVTVACEEMFGSFTVDLSPGETKRITFGVKANAYPRGAYSYDDLKYEIGRREKWEVESGEDGLVMRKIKG